MNRLVLQTTALIMMLGIVPHISAQSWAGFVSVEPRIFLQSPEFADQRPQTFSPSLAFEPEWRWSSRDGRHLVTARPFLRWDADDVNRTHADIRELNWIVLEDGLSYEFGIGRVFWGVTEARHLVDIVNQTDLVEDVDEEEKLGQPMVAIERLVRDGAWGIWILPGFRDRTFPAPNARLGGGVPIDANQALYESGAGRRRVDVAVRRTWGRDALDLGFSGFYGTSREPRFVQSDESLIPYYDLISQVGVDGQWTQGAWLWKFEGIYRHNKDYSFAATVAGFEYTYFGAFGSGADVGLLAEWLYDARPANAPPTAYNDDLFAGIRIELNNLDSSRLLGGIIVDRKDHEWFAFLEAQRRLSDHWQLSVDARLFGNVNPLDPVLSRIERDSYLTVRLVRYL